MPLIRTIQINACTKIGIWEIIEPESYFLSFVSAQKDLKHPHKRLQHLAGRLLLKTLYPDFPVEKIKVNDKGRPYLLEDIFHFSISHSGKYAVAIVSSISKVGIDIEKVSPRVSRLASRFLNEKEYQKIPEEEMTYTLCWSAKEAIYKWVGKKDTQIRKHISIKPFHLKQKDSFDAVLNCQGVEKDLKVYYEKIANFVLVWVVE